MVWYCTPDSVVHNGLDSRRVGYLRYLTCHSKGGSSIASRMEKIE